MSLKQELSESLISLNKQFQNEFKTNKLISRDYFVQHSEYSALAYCKEFGSYSNFKSEVLGIVESELTRDNLDIKKDDSTKGNKRKYFVTGAIPNTPIDHKALESAKTYCKHNKAELIVFPMRGVSKLDDTFDEELLALSDHFCTEFKFNSNLVAKDFKLRPQQINPLTGLGRFGQKEYSLIIPHTKQFLQTVPVSNSKLPHLLYSTGVITLPIYADDRIGEIARQDHVVGGLIVEIKDNDIFFVRQVQFDEKGGFFDLDKYYRKDKVKENCKAAAFVFGDYHSGFQDEKAKKAFIDCSNKVQAQENILHDFFNGTSICHHEEDDIRAQLERPDHIDTLEKELDYAGVELQELRTKLKQGKIVITRSNHDEWLDRYLGKRRFIDDRFNYKISLLLSYYYLEHKNPLQAYIEEKHIKDNSIIWLKRDEDRKICGVQVGAHGDIGLSGSRASVYALELTYGKAVVGHTHTCRIFRELWNVGTTCGKLSYMRGPSQQVQSSCIVHSNSTRQMIIAIEGEYCL